MTRLEEERPPGIFASTVTAIAFGSLFAIVSFAPWCAVAYVITAIADWGFSVMFVLACSFAVLTGLFAGCGFWFDLRKDRRTWWDRELAMYRLRRDRDYLT